MVVRSYTLSDLPAMIAIWNEVVEDGIAVRRAIVIDGYQADGVRVKSGLQAGDTLITEGYQKLYKDCKVLTEF